MANILPKDALTAVRKFYRARFVLVGSLVSIMCGVVTLLALMPAYALMSAELTAANDDLQVVYLPPSADRDDIVRAQALVRELRPLASSTVSALNVLDGILGARPAGVVVSSMSYIRGDPGTIVISGTAPSRDEISAYRAALSKDLRFRSVSVPIGILAGAEDGQFSVTLTGAF